MYPPQGSQQPGNYPPYGAPPSGTIPPNQRQSKGGCWMWGGLGCLVIFLIVGGIVGYSAYKLTHSSGGFGGMMQSAQNAGKTTAQASHITTALKQYKTDNGHYPATLTDLVPKYLPSVDSLHAPSDPNPNPTHISYDYHQPATDASGTAPLLGYHTAMNIDISGMKEHMDMKTTIEVGGGTGMDTTTTMTTPDGKTSTSTSHSETPAPTTSP